LNGDGENVIIVNNHETNSSLSAIYTYSLPENLFDGPIERTLIADGFKNAFSFFVPNMCPGFPYAVQPRVGDIGPMHILIAGDGDYTAHLMRPQGDKTYTRETVLDLKGTVGSIASADIDGDGFLEFFVPNYDAGYIEIF
jgi:hypothetical protein